MARDAARSVLAPTPSIGPSAATVVAAGTAIPESATAVGLAVTASGPVPAELGVGRERLDASGFRGAVGEAIVVPTADGPTVVGFGLGDPSELDTTGMRDAAAAFARAVRSHTRLAFRMPDADGPAVEDVAQSVVEGVLLARYGYDPLRRDPKSSPVAELTLVTDGDREAATRAGADHGRAFAAAGQLARDLANTPHSHLNASRLADLAVELGPVRGLQVEVFDEDALIELGCGGLLGVNAGSAEPPRMIKLTYLPKDGNGAAVAPTGRLTFVGKGIMYDSGGLALKPGDEVHAQMKNDMSGAAAVLAAMSALADLGCTTAVTGYLMCTDNMPSGTAMALGDVITIRGGTTVEVINTDAEGRLVMADALVLATEEPTDAIVDIATLTGACMRALGTQVAGVFGNHQGLVDQISVAAVATDEPVWQLPLERRYRKELDSTVADLKNLGGANAGAITAALFLEEFVGEVPWAHIDIAGTAQSSADASWRTAGCTGFGARLLLQLAAGFTPPAS
jgi:leucyl aminopeptidase